MQAKPAPLTRDQIVQTSLKMADAVEAIPDDRIAVVLAIARICQGATPEEVVIAQGVLALLPPDSTVADFQTLANMVVGYRPAIRNAPRLQSQPNRPRSV